MKLERFKEKKKINKVIIIVFLLLLITAGYILGRTHSKYIYETNEIPFINGKVKYTSGFGSGDVNFAFYVDGASETTMPKKDTGYMYEAKTSKCDKDATIEWDNARWAPTILNLNQTKTSCEIHFNKRQSFGDTIILADQPNATDVADAKTKIKAKGTPNFSSNETTDMGLYMAKDDLGESYYFRGNIPDNWVSFANLYWRIVRVNGDGTVRLIYNGNSKSQTGASTQITTQIFNNSYDNPRYVGYKYGTYDGAKNTYSNLTNSSIKDYLENTWFDGALGSFTDYLADEIFCNDRSITSGNGSSGENYYGPYTRLYDSTNPSLECPNANDRFAIGLKVGNVDTNGQIAEGKPVGLITADEVMMAGGTRSENNSFYLYTNSYYWTMSPSNSPSSGYAREWSVISEGSLLHNYRMDGKLGVRPVINLKASVSVSGGKGTTDEPYTLH